MGIEPFRAALEYVAMQLMSGEALPRGDGHPVVIFPGLAGERHSVGPLKKFCERLGYQVYDWGRGFNTGPQGDADRWIDELAHDIFRLAAPHQQTVSLIGWSLGGIYAREVGKKLGPRVRQVITLGTPFGGAAERNNVTWLYRLLNGEKTAPDAAWMARMATAPDVPTTSIFSRSDGVVVWQACLQDGNRHDTENVEVDGSHCGLGWNVDVLTLIADRLSQPEDGWQRHPRSVSIAEALQVGERRFPRTAGQQSGLHV
jgi:hypothetical protein